jgi:hypothetical protein
MRISYATVFRTINFGCQGIRLQQTGESLADVATGRGLLRSFSFLHTNVE